jgi:hemicentin
MVALPSGIGRNQDLVRLLVYDQYNNPVTQTKFRLIDDEDAPFGLRTTADGKGVVFTLRPLIDKKSYRLKIEGIAYDPTNTYVLYHTTFMIYISVSSYPY